MKSYVVCGVGNRVLNGYIRHMVTVFADQLRIVGLLDADPKRFEVCKTSFPQTLDVPGYLPDQFEQMIAETKPDAVIVAGRDHTHAHYIIKALEHDLDVITEKPMATTGEDCKRIMEAEACSKGKVTVAFNFRYPPYHRRIKELILEGKLGRITSIDLNWYCDTYHGASYFKRWNRIRANSGGLSIHKSTHHFDLVNWWVDQQPVEVFAYGALNYYGPDSELNPSRKEGRRCSTCEEKLSCAYYSRWSSRSQDMAAKPAESQYSDYSPDACIFDAEIDIEDTYTASVKYDKGTLLSYTVNFSAPYEGYRLAINGTKGRIETMDYIARERIPFPVAEQTIEYYPLFGAKEIIRVVQTEGGHGGGDPILLEDMFLGADGTRPYEIMAGARAGAYSVAIGEAVWRSVRERRPVTIAELLEGVGSGMRQEMTLDA